jgi:hypothetical protein
MATSRNPITRPATLIPVFQRTQATRSAKISTSHAATATQGDDCEQGRIGLGAFPVGGENAIETAPGAYEQRFEAASVRQSCDKRLIGFLQNVGCVIAIFAPRQIELNQAPAAVARQRRLEAYVVRLGSCGSAETR